MFLSKPSAFERMRSNRRKGAERAKKAEIRACYEGMRAGFSELQNNINPNLMRLRPNDFAARDEFHSR